ncbi:hypothetical protein ACO0LC_09575 [Undibacterium sp. JH2W]|uniref:hypothetical protein n=1 Tax=Undibacterium sp. JH2W TaxID=3413037 RepID=UPI003BEF4D37
MFEPSGKSVMTIAGAATRTRDTGNARKTFHIDMSVYTSTTGYLPIINSEKAESQNIFAYC